ncbi:hypothetical protein SprV_0100257400 [Sparganum proliferum]
MILRRCINIILPISTYSPESFQRRKQFRMELEPQICFWSSFDELSQDEYISCQENSTQEPGIADDKQKDLESISDNPSCSIPSQEVNLLPKTLENVSSEETSCPISSIACQNDLEIAPFKDEVAKSPRAATCPTQEKYTITDYAPQPKLLLKQVRGQWRPQSVGSSSELCLICDRYFHDRRALNAHLTRMHAPTRNLRDTTANGLKSRKATSGRRSSKNHNDGSPGDNCWILQCGLCQMTFFKARDLHQHTIAMHGAARIIIKTPWPQERTTKDARDSDSTALTSPQPTATKVTQASPVVAAKPAESATEKTAIGEVDTAERNSSSSVNDDLRESLSSFSAGRTVVDALEAPLAQTSNSSDLLETPASEMSHSFPGTPEKFPRSVASVNTTDPISTTRMQDDNGRLHLTSMSNLESDRNRGNSVDRLGSPDPLLPHVSYSELPTIHIASESTSSGTCSQRETSVCTVAPTAKESTSPIVSTHHFPSSLSSPILPSGLARKQFRMELEPQICFWGSFDELSQDEYISCQENSTQEPGIADDKHKDLEMNLPPKTLESVSSEETSCPISSVACQNDPEIAPFKDEVVKSPKTATCPTQEKYTITDYAPQPKLLLKQVRGQWRPQSVGSSSELCLICNRYFHDRRALNAHLTRMHAPTRNLRDTTANGLKSRKATSGRRSSKNHNDGSPGDNCWILQCGLCQMTFFKARDLHQHTIAMHGAARIIIKTPWPQERTTKDARDSDSTALTSPQPTATKVTQASPVVAAKPAESATEKTAIGEVDTAERNSSSSVNDDLRESLSSFSAGRTVVDALEAPLAQTSNSSDLLETPASEMSHSFPGTPEKFPRSVASVNTTDPISTTRMQDDNGRLHLTSMSNLESDRNRGNSVDRLGSPDPLLPHVSYSELPTIHIASESTSSGTCSQRETSVCTVAPTAKESTSPIVSTHHFPSSLSSPILPSGLAYVGRNGNEEKSATAPECAQSSAHVSPSSRPNLKRPQSDLLTDCLHCSARAGGDICPQKCMRQTPRTPISLPVAICMAESHESSPSLATLVSSTPVTTVTPSSNQRHCDVCMNLRRCKGECQVEMTAKMLLGKTHEFLAEINRRPLEVVKPLVHALQRLLFTMEANVFVAYMNDLLPEASRNALENPYLKRILSQPTFPNEKPQDVARTTLEQPSNVLYAGFQEATGFGKRGGGFQCQCSSGRFKGTISGQQVYGPSDSCSSLVPLGSQLAAATSRSMESATSLHNGLQISSKQASWLHEADTHRASWYKSIASEAAGLHQ